MTPAAAKSPPSLLEAAVQFARLLKLARPFWRALAGNVLLGLVAGAVGTALPWVGKLLFDEVYPARDVRLLHVVVAGLLTLSVVHVGLAALRAFFGTRVNTRLGNAVQLLFFNHLQHLPMRFFDARQVGEITSRFNDSDRGVYTLSRVLETVLVHGVHLLLVPPLLVLLEWRLALLSLVSLPLIMGVTGAAGRLQRRVWSERSEAYADLHAYQVEVLSHVRTLKSMGLEREVWTEASGRARRATERDLRAARLSQGLGGLTGALRAANTAALTWYAFVLILSGRMTLGDYVAFTAYLGLLYGPLFMLVQLWSDLQQAAVHLGRMFEYLDAVPEQDPALAQGPPPPAPRRLRGGFRLAGVSFGYDPERPVLADLDLELPAGSVTALVGPSGSGKTTLLRLLAALEAPVSGRIEVDGRPLSRLPLSEYRRQVAAVWQDAGLMRGTLWQNLTLGVSPEPRRPEVDAAVARCGLARVVAGLPAGYGTEVAEWGASLSAGQRQRVLIARAVLRGAPILLLDEATANVDLETEAAVLGALVAGLGGRTLVYVTHRLATAALADRVAVLEAGRLVDVGPHRELLARCEPYRRMVGAATGEAARFRRAAEA